MERSLASIQKVKEVKTHPNADKLDLIYVLGWQLVAKRGDFKVNDLCVFCEIDSILPEKPEFEFLRSKKFRIKTCKLRSEISQGIAFPLSILPPSNYIEGQDVTEVLNIKKWEPVIPAQLQGKILGNFPTHLIPKTDEIRIQTLVPNIFDEIDGKDMVATVKVDGTSATFYSWSDYKDKLGIGSEHFGVCSRNLELKEEEGLNIENENVYWKMAKKYDLVNILRGKNLGIQAEICGPGIQKNRLQLNELQIFVFNVYDLNARRYYNHDEVVKFCNQHNLPMVPVEIIVKFDKALHVDILKHLLEFSKGKYKGTSNDREGLVWRPLVECNSEVLKGRLSFKVLNNDALLLED